MTEFNAFLSREPMVHALKTLPEPFAAIRRGEKTADLRFDDRDFRVGDRLVLLEHRPVAGFTGREEHVEITHITRVGQWITGADHRWCMLSFKRGVGKPEAVETPTSWENRSLCSHPEWTHEGTCVFCGKPANVAVLRESTGPVS